MPPLLQQSATNVVAGIPIDVGQDVTPFLSAGGVPCPARWVGTSFRLNTQATDDVDAIVTALIRKPNGRWVANALVANPVMAATAAGAVAQGAYVTPTFATVNGKQIVRYAQWTPGSPLPVVGRATQPALQAGDVFTIAIRRLPPEREIVYPPTPAALTIHWVNNFGNLTFAEGATYAKVFTSNITTGAPGIPDGLYFVTPHLEFEGFSGSDIGMDLHLAISMPPFHDGDVGYNVGPAISVTSEVLSNSFEGSPVGFLIEGFRSPATNPNVWLGDIGVVLQLTPYTP